MTETPKDQRTFGSRKSLWSRLRSGFAGSLHDFYKEDSLILSASIAYYGMIGIFPFLILLLGLSGIYINRYELTGTLAVVLDRYLPMKPDFILRNLVVISKAYGRVGLASFVLLLWASSGVFVPLEKALNRAWQVKNDRRWIESRILALEFAVIFGFFFLLFCGLAGLNIYIRHWAQHRLAPEQLFWFLAAYWSLALIVTFGMTLGIMLILFARLPNRLLRVREVLPGALVTSVLWELSRIVFTLLLKHINYGHIYGSIGAAVALMTWAYASAAVLLFGARISHKLYSTLYPQNAFQAEPLRAVPAEPSSA